MTEFRMTQISDTHLSRAARFARLTENFHRVSERIDAVRPDLVINSGDVSWDGPTSRDDLDYAKELHAALPVGCRYLPGNHDIGDNPTAVGKLPSLRANERDRAAFIDVFAEDRWQFEAAGWRFIGLNSLVMNTGLASEIEQEDWLKSQLSGVAPPHGPILGKGPYITNTRHDVQLKWQHRTGPARWRSRWRSARPALRTPFREGDPRGTAQQRRGYEGRPRRAHR